MNVRASAGHAARFRSLDLNRNPFIVFWEITRACALSCVHCRANAEPKAHPLELNTQESLKIVDSLAEFEHPPLLVVSGGDPFMRRDLFQLIEHAKTRGLNVAVAPSATALVVEKRLRKLVELGVGSVSFSLDGATAETHDAFRGFKGTFDRTLRMMTLARKVGMPFQVNTTVSKRTVQDLPKLGELLTGYGPSTWDLFFLVPTGRAALSDVLGAREHERVFNWVLDNSENWKFRVKTTLAPHYRRAYILRKMAADSMSQVPEEARPIIRDGWPGPVTNDGRGTMFISHLGEIYPSGFLPVRAGNVRTHNLVDTYRSSPVFRSLRDIGSFKGKCGACQFNEVCGGSRARAYGMTRDMLGTDPSCAYVPKVA